MRPGSRIPNGQEPSPVPAPPGQQAKDRPGPSDPHHPSSFRDGSTTMPSTTQYRRRGTTGRAARAGSCDRRGASMNIRRTVITVAAALALAAGGTAAGAVAFASSGTTYQGCVVGTSRILEHVYTRANPPACPAGSFAATWNQAGQQGPSGVVSMARFDPGDGAIVTTPGSFAFTGSTVTEHFADSNTAAEVTATVDEASTDGNFIDVDLGICYEPAGGSTLTNVSFVEPNFQAPANSFIAQTVSGVVGNLAAGDYLIGMCQKAASANLVNGSGAGTIIMAETASGVSSAGLRHGATPAQPHPARHR